MPLSLKPPNGVAMLSCLYVLIQTVPASIAPATAGRDGNPRSRSTCEAVGGIVGLGDEVVLVVEGRTHSTGPKISSRQARAALVRPVITVGR